jgi:hypothetical protein
MDECQVLAVGGLHAREYTHTDILFSKGFLEAVTVPWAVVSLKSLEDSITRSLNVVCPGCSCVFPFTDSHA